MTVFEINGIPYGSTYKIMAGIALVAEAEGINTITATGYSYHPDKNLPENHVHIGGFFNKALHMAFAKLFGIEGYNSVLATRRLINVIKRSRVDIVHFHNIHGAYLNFPMLFGYLKRERIPVVWTLHDCWNFTGLCPNFSMAKCNKWIAGCGGCPQCKSTFSGYLVDRSDRMWKKKKEWFTGIERSVIVTPSNWLAELVKQSFLKDYPIKVINNGIDLNVFSPKENCRRKLGIPEDKYILLGVAMGWDERKGLDVFVSLAERLDERFQIILIGTNEQVEKRIPGCIRTIRRTQDQTELAEYYSAADILINPTREDNFPTVNLEALACGTPVITFDTGGSPEMLDNSCGIVVPCDDVAELEKRIVMEYEQKSFIRENCRRKALAYDMNEKFMEYIELYKAIAKGGGRL